MSAERGKQFPEEFTASPGTMQSTGEAAPDWNKHYGKAFRFAKTPANAVTGGAAPGTISLVTPENCDAWDSWDSVDENHLSTLQGKWNSMWENAGGYKQRQVLANLKDA